MYMVTIPKLIMTSYLILWDQVLHPGYLIIQTCCFLLLVISMLIDGRPKIEQILSPTSLYAEISISRYLQKKEPKY